MELDFFFYYFYSSKCSDKATHCSAEVTSADEEYNCPLILPDWIIR